MKRRSGGGPAVRSLATLATGLAVAAVLPIAAACSNGGGNGGGGGGSGSPSASGSPGASASAGVLTAAGARSALITEADLGYGWNEEKGAAGWRDSLPVGKVDVAEFLDDKASAAVCQKFVDALYTDELLGKPSGASALTGFSDADRARMLYQVASYDRNRLDDSMAWLRTVPSACDQFTITGDGGGKRTVQVVEAPLPKTGDARQGLNMTVKGTVDGEPLTFTADIAAVRVGSSAITVTNGGLDGVEPGSTRQAVEQGTRRLEAVLAGKTPPEQPPGPQD